MRYTSLFRGLEETVSLFDKSCLYAPSLDHEDMMREISEANCFGLSLVVGISLIPTIISVKPDSFTGRG